MKPYGFKGKIEVKSSDKRRFVKRIKLGYGSVNERQLTKLELRREKY